MTADQVEPGRFVLLPSGRPIEVLQHIGSVCECRYVGTQDYIELRIDWLCRHGRPYAANRRGAM